MSLVVITDCDHPSIEIERTVLEAAGHEVRLAQCRTEDDVIRHAAGATGVLVQYAPISERVLVALPSIRAIGRYGVSLDPIDLDAAARREIAVVNVPDYCTEEVADHALALILALTRGVVALDRGIHRGVWDFRLGGELRRSADLQLGIVGLGRIGSAVAVRARALRFRVVACDPRRRLVDGASVAGVPLVELDELLATSDIVSLHAPLDPSTRHLIDAAALRTMKPGALLVNTARGGLIDQAALVDALRAGTIGGAGLDVLETEPLAAVDPLLDLPNVILTPHAAFYTRESLIEMKRRVSERLVAALAGA